LWDNLRPTDMVGVLMFDNSFQWAVTIRKARTALIKRSSPASPRWRHADRARADGGYRNILPINATYKHIVLLTDGSRKKATAWSFSKEAQLRRSPSRLSAWGAGCESKLSAKVATTAGGQVLFPE